MAGQADSLKSILFALFANSAIALAEMEAFLRGRPEVEELYRLLTMQFGPDAMVVD